MFELNLKGVNTGALDCWSLIDGKRLCFLVALISLSDYLIRQRCIGSRRSCTALYFLHFLCDSFAKDVQHRKSVAF